MKKAILFFSFLFVLIISAASSFSQTVTTTAFWTGAQAQGCCNVCGTDYWCINNTGGCGTTAACANRTFTDPVPAGNTVTAVTVTHYTAPCGVGSIPTSINGTSVGSVTTGSDCACGSCYAYSTNASFPCGMPGYNYGGTNTLTLCPNDVLCVQRSVIALTYVATSSLLSVAPTGATATPNPICAGNSTTLNVVGGSLGSGASWNWYSGSCGGTLVGTGASITVSPGATTTYYVRAQGTCNTTTCTSVTVTVTAGSTAPSSATASPNPICGGSTTLTVNGGSLGTGASWNWYSGSCGGTFVGTGASIIVSPVGTTTYFVQASGGCNTTTCASVTVTVNTSSTAPTSASASINPTCGGATTLTVNGGSLGSGAAWTWYSGSCGGTLVGTGASLSVSPATTTTYFVGAVGTCNTTTCVSVTVTVNTSSSAPASASASPNPICGGSTTLTVNGGSLGTGASWNWYSGSCNGTLVGNGTSITVSPASTTTYFVNAVGTCNTTTCASVTVTVDIASTDPTSASASPNPICSGSTTLTVNGGSLGTGAAWTWYSGSCGGTLEGTGTSLVVTPSSTTTYFVQAVGSCNTTSCVSVTVTLSTASTAPTSATASPNPVCAGSSATLSLSGGTLGSGSAWMWYSGSCGGTLEGTGASLVVSPSVTTTYFVRAEGTCNTTACVSVTVTVDQAPTPANAGQDTTVCGLSATLAANVASIGTGSWAQVSGPGTITFTNINSATSSITADAYGSYVIAWAIVNGVCSTSDSVMISFDEAPALSNAGQDITVCGLSATLSAVIPSVGTGTWIQASGPGSITFNNINSESSSITADAYGSFVIAWNIVNGVCSTSDSVTVSFDEAPTPAGTGSDTFVCGLATTLLGNAPVVGTGIWNETTGTLTFANLNDETSVVTSTTYGTFTLSWTIVNGVCTSSDTLDITFFEAPIAADAGLDSTICGGNVTLNAVAPVIGNGYWTVISGTGIPADSTDNNTLVTNVSAGQSLFVWTVSNGVCPVSEDTVIITMNPSSIVADFSANPTVSFADEKITFTDLSTGATIWSWSFGDGKSSNNQNPLHVYTTTGGYIVTLVIENEDGCIDSISSTIEIIEGIKIPNVFSPNSDGVNDVFEIKASGVVEFSLTIFNRFGQTIYSTTATKIYWDGRTLSGQPIADGTYFYTLNAVFKTDAPIMQQGFIQVLR